MEKQMAGVPTPADRARAARRRTIGVMVLCMLLPALCLAAGIALNVYSWRLGHQYLDITDQYDGEDEKQTYLAALQTQRQGEVDSALADYADSVSALLTDCPVPTGRVLRQAEAAMDDGATLTLVSYDAGRGTVEYELRSETASVADCVRALENCGAFTSVEYGGYTAEDGACCATLYCALPAQGSGHGE